MVGFGIRDGQVVFDMFRHQSVMEQVKNDLFRHRQNHFQKYDYVLGFLFALSKLRSHRRQTLLGLPLSLALELTV